MDITVIENGSGLVKSNNLTWDLMQSWFNYLDVKPKTYTTYVAAVKQFYKWTVEHGISSPTRADIIAYRDELKETRKPTTVQSYMIALRQFYSWAEVELGLVNVAKNVKGAKIGSSHKKDSLAQSEAKKLLKTLQDGEDVKSLRDYAIVLLMLQGGLRTCEVSRADVADMTTKGNNKVLYLLGKGRDEKSEYVKLMPQTVDAINAYLSARGKIKDTDPLFASASNHNGGGRMAVGSVSRIVKTALRAAGLNNPRLTAHSTRHTAVTFALMSGLDIREVQEFARHKNITTTEIYAHDLDREKNHCEENITKMLF